MAVARFRGEDIVTGPYFAPGKHRHLVFVDPESGKETLVLRGGGVVNMTRGMPPEYSQLTRGLVLTCILLAAKMARRSSPREDTAGRVGRRLTVDRQAQDALVAFVQADLKARGLPPLERPDFRAVPRWYP
jgi:hypothetical protein